MFQRNDIWAGLVIGLIFPLLIFGFLYVLVGPDLLHLSVRERSLALVAILGNLLFTRRYRRLRWDAALQGLVAATSILAVVWLVRYGGDLFSAQ